MALPLGSRIGIIGGGQLGRMLAMAANRLGYKTSVLDPDKNAPAFDCSHGRIVAAYDDPEGLKELAETCDVITYEFENVDVGAVEMLEARLPCHPSSHALAVSQDRLTEKEFFNNLGIKTAPFHNLKDEEALNEALAETGGSGIVKTRRFGYDGKGQIRILDSDPAAISEAVKLISASPSILEGLVSFKREISIVAARGQDGEIRCFDVAENVHKNGILDSSTVPSNANAETISKAGEIAVRVLGALDYVGVLAIEFFELEDSSLLVNEFAPRVHNSGHWTEAACILSQFEQHIRAVAGMTLGDTTRHSNCVMQNLIGSDIGLATDISGREQTMLHVYGKGEVREGRKMGHFTTITPIEPR